MKLLVNIVSMATKPKENEFIPLTGQVMSEITSIVNAVIDAARRMNNVLFVRATPGCEIKSRRVRLKNAALKK